MRYDSKTKKYTSIHNSILNNIFGTLLSFGEFSLIQYESSFSQPKVRVIVFI